MATEQTVAPLDLLDPADQATQERYESVRRCTEQLCQPLATEDYVVQSMPDASPVKWHVAHTSWFFETFALAPHLPGYECFRPEFGALFNSYYHAVGPRWPRPQRGLLSRPTVANVFAYRAYVDECIAKLFQRIRRDRLGPVSEVVLLGTHHEQQHQELILTDIKHAFALNPLRPAYRPIPSGMSKPPSLDWVFFPAGRAVRGHEGSGFAFDNEMPRHYVYLAEFRLANRLVTNREYLGFLEDGGYERADLWLSDGWNTRQAQDWTCPFYWERNGETWQGMTLGGLQELDLDEPVCHVSFYEANAFARWAGARLPTEAEWETAAALSPVAGHFLDGGRFHPAAEPAADDRGPVFQLYGNVWQWTASSYAAYPGYAPPTGLLREYNAKFMCNQMVLRGASCVTPRSHARSTYRNYFPPDTRWQFSGIRLAKDGT